MAEYIKRETVLAHLQECEGTPPEIAYTYPIFKAIECFVEELPAADVAPVVHGRWIECDYMKYDGHSECIHYPSEAWKCSVCCNAFKKELLWKDNFCPNCGAIMDGE